MSGFFGKMFYELAVFFAFTAINLSPVVTSQSVDFERA